MSKLWTTLGLSLLMQVFTRPFVQQRLFRYWLTRNPLTAEMTATGTATARCSVERETEINAGLCTNWRHQVTAGLIVSNLTDAVTQRQSDLLFK